MKASVYVGISVDGFIARSDGSVDFLDDHAPADSDLGYSEFMSSVDVLVMGRNTFDFVMELDVDWPYGELLVVVLTHRPVDLPAGFAGVVEVSALGPAALLGELSERGLKHAYIDGGHTVLAFLAADLIDEITLTTVPSLVGNGISIFDGSSAGVRLELVSSLAESNGFVQTKYRVLHDE